MQTGIGAKYTLSDIQFTSLSLIRASKEERRTGIQSLTKCLQWAIASLHKYISPWVTSTNRYIYWLVRNLGSHPCSVCLFWQLILIVWNRKFVPSQCEANQEAFFLDLHPFIFRLWKERPRLRLKEVAFLL